MSTNVRPAVASASSSPDLAGCREHVRTVVAGSGTSFYWGMRLLPAAKREAMFAIYAFCREVDDIADSDDTRSSKTADLARWRDEIEALYAGRPSRPTSRALAAPIERFDLPRGEFDAMIDGMEMDASATMRAPSFAALERYCRCVAGAVGVLSVHVFEARSPDRESGALALGEALQLTNILRDLAEDAQVGRLYLPREVLDRHGIHGDDPFQVLAHPLLPGVCGELAARAMQRFDEADRWLAQEERRAVRPALIMRGVYRLILDRLIAEEWQRLLPPVRVSKAARLWVAIRQGLL
ncbi:MAG: presqualene diphosphate synthase HpnD [Pseudomonadota bacterium]